MPKFLPALFFYVLSILTIGNGIWLYSQESTCPINAGPTLAFTSLGSIMFGFATYQLLHTVFKQPLWEKRVSLQVLLALLVAIIVFVVSVGIAIRTQPDGIFQCYVF